MFFDRRTNTAAAIAIAIASTGLAAGAAEAKPVPGQYIVSLQEGATPADVARSADAKRKKTYTAALNGFAAELSPGQVRQLERDPRVNAVEQDQVVSATTTQFMSGGEPWGLDRSDQRDLPLSGSFTYNKDGTGVRVYVLDTGIQPGHPEFGHRGLSVFNATSGGPDDCHGHGTHVAGTVGARTYGVAKNAYLRSVKVLGGDCSKNGTWADVLEGLDYVRANHIKPAVVNMSLGGGKVDAVNTAVRSVIDAGVFVAVSAGNDNVDACTASPASTPSAFTVAASTRTDAKAGYSNWGSCVDAYAPGSGVKSSHLGGGTASMSGTSMASPHVAGTAALLCDYGSDYCKPSFVTSWITRWATADKITGNPPGTPNRLLWKGTL